MTIYFKKGILIALGELFLKSEGVKRIFQKRLINNLRFYLKKEKVDFKLILSRERIFINAEKATRVVGNIFGVSWFAECFCFSKITLKDFSGFISNNYKDWIKKGETFALRVKVEEGILKENKKEVIDKIAEKINRKVNLDNPDQEIFVEIRKNSWFLYFKKEKGRGGLPFGSGGKVLTLMSGGIDSPVASYLMLKKGCKNIWLHFHSFPLISKASIEKTKELAKIFLKYQPKLKIYFIPFQKAQIEIKAKVDAKYRILLYRRLMLRIAEQIAKKENCGALVTGESLGQVSSQTLPNMKITEEAVKIPVLRPLVAYDKEEIIALAERIGTFKTSIKPQEDCCTLFTPKHPTAEGKIEEVKKLEKKLNIKKLIQQVIKESEIVVE